ncbi:coth-domain-containing protein [Anaeromyces robustus]|uniref:Coth-domain-containing protein n=1 Tax=Anaeromyces robustus TaxID=1754192 RepID=A0A1Y1XLE5_9FUNG|nr:coth-domain-containing protein [Anaeromyces robustus]|eukprot:ORX86578.1 coth-domain-containing protein [Anaeromyces robustus]
MRFLKIFSTLSLLAFSANAAYWDNVERTELYEMLEKSVPVMHVTMPDSTWSEMVQKAQISNQSQNTYFEVEANMKFIYEGNEEDYTINFKLGGKSSTEFSRPGYNIKIKGSDKTLHGTKNFRLRSDQRDPTYMRTKLSTEVIQKSGLIAVEAGYVELFVNDDYMGFWVISDSIKKNWLKRKFGDEREEVRTLYQCKADGIRFDDGTAKSKCVNSNEDIADYMEPFYTFVDQVNAAKTRADLEKIMDVDNFLKYIAWEYLIGSWDHILGPFGHNIYWYQQPNGKWVYLPYDFDLDLGSCMWDDQFSIKSYFKGEGEIDFPAISFKDFELDHPIIKILVHDDDTRFRELLGDVVSKVFNPDTLLTRIEELKEFVAPYVKNNIETGAGKINKICPKQCLWTYQEFLDNIEYTYVYDTHDYVKAFGLKYWIRRRYNSAAAYYGINTNATSSDKKHKLIEPRPEPVILYPYRVNDVVEKISDRMSYHHYGEPLPDYTPDKSYSDDRVPVLGINQYNVERLSKGTEPSKPSEPKTEECWSEALGYKCCSKGCDAVVLAIDNSGNWGAENGEWCGIQCDFEKDECPGKKYGYSCCETCDVYLNDDEGKWGVDNGYWCSIKTSCQ